jgi:uncharacterized protein (TIGR00255 family)
MTGYGRSLSTTEKGDIVVEVKSINHRFCDVSLKLPQRCFPLENDIKKLVLSRVARGRIDLSVQLDCREAEGTRFELNMPLARQYLMLLKDLRGMLQLPGEITLDHLLTQKEIIVAQTTNHNSACDWETLKGPLSSALDELVKMRETEGLQLKEDFLSRLNQIENRFERIRSLSGATFNEYQKSLREKIRALCKDMEIDETRLAQEVAYLVEKSDIEEELVRVMSHVRQFRQWLETEDAVGRKLEFLVQEIHREVNTISSKAGSAEISLKVVEIKNELERIREQVQNIE